MRRLLGITAAVVGLSLVAGPTAEAQSDDDAPRRPASSTPLGDTGLWFVPTGEILPQGRWSASIQRTNNDRAEGISDISHFLATFAYGVHEKVELFGSFRAMTRIDRDSRPLFDDVSKVGGPTVDYPLVTDGFTGTQVGDLIFGGKFNITSEQTQAPLAFAVRGLVKIPTGSDDNGVSTGKADTELDLIASKDLGGAEVSAFGGMLFRGDPDGVTLPSSFRWGGGVRVPLGTSFGLFGEVTGDALNDDVVELDSPLVGTDGSISGLFPGVQRPLDITVGLQWNASNGMYVGAGLNISAIHDIEDARSKTGERFGFLVRIGYHPGVDIYVPPPPPAPEMPNRPPTVSLTCEPCEILIGQESRLRADAQDPDGDPLTFEWSAPTGEFLDEENRETRRWQASNRPGPVPITVTVDDGRGGTATDTTTITVVAPPPPPVREYVFEDVHFDFDRYSLRPGAARVLDEIVAAMQDDENLSIQIEGHTCNIGTAEYNLALGERRANSVQEYLTSRGVDAGRLSTISYGEERPEYDNSREETRRLNRRAAMVVRLQ